jgi:hypothetical protein
VSENTTQNPGAENTPAKCENCETVKQQLADANAEIEMLREENTALKVKLAEKEAEAPSKEKFTYGENEYEILVAKARIPGLGVRTAIEIASDTQAQEILVRTQSGLIRDIK